jgi:crossover junction endodeoxyribonuclease RusA
MISLPFPPSMNTYWRNVRGKTLISLAGRQYRTAVHHAITVSRISGLIDRETITRPIRVDILATPPDKRRRDLDNLLKAPLDALTHAGVWTDDSLIHHLSIRWADGQRAALTVFIDFPELSKQSYQAGTTSQADDRWPGE